MKIGILGDSRIAGVGALPEGYEGIDELMKFQCNHEIVKFATPSTNIQYMRDVWAALTTEEQQSFDYLVMEVGYNDISPSQSLSTVMGKIQALVNDIYATKKSTCKIIVNHITPLLGTYQSYSAGDKTTIYNLWVAINECISGSGANPLTNANIICSEHIAILEDPAIPGRLKSIYDSGADYVHPNRLAKDIIADSVLKLIV